MDYDFLKKNTDKENTAQIPRQRQCIRRVIELVVASKRLNLKRWISMKRFRQLNRINDQKFEKKHEEIMVQLENVS